MLQNISTASGAVVKNPYANAGAVRDAGSIPGSGRSPGIGKGNSLQHSCLENSIDREAWWATVHGVMKSWTRLSDWAHTHTHSSFGISGTSKGCRKVSKSKAVFFGVCACVFLIRCSFDKNEFHDIYCTFKFWVKLLTFSPKLQAIHFWIHSRKAQ